MVNHALGDLLRFLTGKHVKSWDQKLCQAEFAHNHAMSRSTRFSHFQVVYSIVLRGPLDLISLPSRTRVHGKAEKFVGGLQEIHKKVHDANKKHRHVEFEVGDYIWAVLTKDRFFCG